MHQDIGCVRITSNWFLVCLALCFFVLSTANYSHAEEAKSTVTLKVSKIEGDIALYHSIKVYVENLDKWLSENGHSASDFELSIDGNIINGPKAALMDNNTALRYDLMPDDLKRTPESQNAWKTVLSRRASEGKKYYVNVPITVHNNGASIICSSEAKLIIIDKSWFIACSIVWITGIFVFFWGAWKSDILRIPGPQPEGTDSHGRKNKKRYSLARLQMALWFFVVIGSYFGIWRLTSDLTSLTSSVLALIGISAATGLSSAVVDSSKLNDIENQIRVLGEKKKQAESEKAQLRCDIDRLNISLTNAGSPATDPNQLRLNRDAKQKDYDVKNNEISQAVQQINDLTVKMTPSSKGWMDFLSDDDGLSFHRFQMLTWTLVLIVIFITTVVKTLSMPQFDTTLLALMGISNGTYIGFKLPKQEG